MLCFGGSPRTTALAESSVILHPALTTVLHGLLSWMLMWRRSTPCSACPTEAYSHSSVNSSNIPIPRTMYRTIAVRLNWVKFINNNMRKQSSLWESPRWKSPTPVNQGHRPPRIQTEGLEVVQDNNPSPLRTSSCCLLKGIKAANLQTALSTLRRRSSCTSDPKGSSSWVFLQSLVPSSSALATPPQRLWCQRRRAPRRRFVF